MLQAMKLKLMYVSDLTESAQKAANQYNDTGFVTLFFILKVIV